MGFDLGYKPIFYGGFDCLLAVLDLSAKSPHTTHFFSVEY